MTTECLICDRHFLQTKQNPGCICPECLEEERDEKEEE